MIELLSAGPVRRLWRVLRDNGVVDGFWTVAVAIGSKLQILATMALAGSIDGLDGVGAVVLAIGTGTLCFAFIDAGLSTQVVRSFAARPCLTRSTLVRPLLMRAILYPVVCAGAWWIVSSTGGTLVGSWAWLCAIAAYAFSYQLSSVGVQAAMGRHLFRGASSIHGLTRSATIPFLFLASEIMRSPVLLVVVLAVGEAVIFLLQYKSLGAERQAPPAPDGDARDLKVAQTWRLGVGGLLNMLINKSDVALVAVFATSLTVSVYGVASQIENALATAALVPAGAVVARAAGARDVASLKRQRLVVAAVVAVGYIGLAAPIFAWPQAAVAAVTREDATSSAAVRICVVAGLFSCLGGVALMQLTGKAGPGQVLRFWLVSTIVAIPALAAGSLLYGATGAAIGALARDIVMFAVAWRIATRLERRLETGATMPSQGATVRAPE